MIAAIATDPTEQELDFAASPETGIDPQYYADYISVRVNDIEVMIAEDAHRIAQLPDEVAFCEIVGQLDNLNETCKRAQGMLMWLRLRHVLGFEAARDSRERRQHIARWAMRAGKDDNAYHRFEKYINDAMARELVPAVELMSPTAGDEIVRGIDPDEGEESVRDTIEQRADAVRELDPTLERSTQTVRDVKSHAENGNGHPSLIREKNLAEEQVKPDYVYKARLKTHTTVDPESGEVTDHYEYFPAFALYLDMPPSEELRDQFETYQNAAVRRIGGKSGLNVGKPS